MSNRKRNNPDTRSASPQYPTKEQKTEDDQKNKPIQYTLPITTSSPERPPAFGQPQQLTCFSYTPQRELCFDKSALKYYVPAPLGADLGYRYEHWIKRPEERTRLDSLLRAIEQENVVGERKKGAFVTWRGVMTK
jgi:RAT1-interacting protein